MDRDSVHRDSLAVAGCSRLSQRQLSPSGSFPTSAPIKWPRPTLQYPPSGQASSSVAGGLVTFAAIMGHGTPTHRCSGMSRHAL
jgi:hypothetical protein